VVALDSLSRREHFTGPENLVFGDEVGQHADDDGIRDAFYAALEAAGLGELRERDAPTDIQTPRRYMRYAPKHDEAAKLTAAFATARPGSPLADDDVARTAHA
jgi:hypothetical protein